MVKELIQYIVSRKYREVKCSTTDGQNYTISFIIYDIGIVSFTFLDNQTTTSKDIIETIDNCVTAYKRFGMTIAPNRKRPRPIDVPLDEDEDD